MPAGRELGYARVQDLPRTSLDGQLAALSAAGIPDELIFADRRDGLAAGREGLEAVLACARPGDTIVIADMSRLGRDANKVSGLVRDLAARGVSIRSLFP